MDNNDQPTRHHILIAGTGRAGTTALVKLLSACGLQTHIEKHDVSYIDERAQAGLEDFVIDCNTPYVAKSPWFYLNINDILQRNDIKIDHVIIPIRNIDEVVESRLLLQNMYNANLLYAGAKSYFSDDMGLTPGGAVLSLNAVDQKRILAAGFYDLVYALITNMVPFTFLSFPRFVQDYTYSYKVLQLILPKEITQEKFLVAAQSTLFCNLVRVDRSAHQAQRNLQEKVFDRLMKEKDDELNKRVSETVALKAELAATKAQFNSKINSKTLEFNEMEYLMANPDVEIAVSEGIIASGYDHWLNAGQYERRPLRLR